MVSRFVKRPEPTSHLIMELCGGNTGLLSRFHHGMCETSLKDFYPSLNLDEVAAFKIGSYILRKENSEKFADSKQDDIYYIFREAFNEGFPRLNTHKNIVKTAEQYSKLNPFGRNFRERVERVDPDAIILLKSRLAQPANKYVFECDYHDAKLSQEGDNSRIVVMHFQPYYPKREVIAPNFAKEIARILENYPQEYAAVQDQKPIQRAYQTDLFQ